VFFGLVGLGFVVCWIVLSQTGDRKLRHHVCSLIFFKIDSLQPQRDCPQGAFSLFAEEVAISALSWSLWGFA